MIGHPGLPAPSKVKRELSILLQSDSGEGKTYQLGELAVWHFRRTGGQYNAKTGVLSGGSKTILYTSDFGDWVVIKPIVDLGIIHVVDLSIMDMPFEWLFKATNGFVPAAVPTPASRWEPWNGALVGPTPHLAYDSMTSMANLLMIDLAKQAAAGGSIGGGVNIKFIQGEHTVASNNMTHYNVVQTAMLKGIADSQRATRGIVSWTARLRRVEEDGQAAVLGPQIAGKAMTPELPGWFTYVFRLAQEVQFGMPNTHVLYVEDHKDMTSPNAKILANGRIPAGVDPKLIPTKQSPANVPAMLDLLLTTAYQQSLDALKTKLTTPLATVL